MPGRKGTQIAGLPTRIIQRGNNRQARFFADDNYQFFLDHLAQLAKRFRCALHAYVLMSNHFHLPLTSVTPFFFAIHPVFAALALPVLALSFANFFARFSSRASCLLFLCFFRLDVSILE